MGTPLFINRETAERYGPALDRATLSGLSIVSNRVVGLHLGLKGKLSLPLTYRLLATHVRHYGNYYNGGCFTPAKKQNNLLLELHYNFFRASLTAAATSDFGDLSHNAAGLLRAEWRLR